MGQNSWGGKKGCKTYLFICVFCIFFFFFWRLCSTFYRYCTFLKFFIAKSIYLNIQISSSINYSHCRLTISNSAISSINFNSYHRADEFKSCFRRLMEFVTLLRTERKRPKKNGGRCAMNTKWRDKTMTTAALLPARSEAFISAVERRNEGTIERLFFSYEKPGRFRADSSSSIRFPGSSVGGWMVDANNFLAYLRWKSTDKNKGNTRARARDSRVCETRS